MFSYRTRLFFIILVLMFAGLQTSFAQDGGGAVRLLSFEVSYGGRAYDEATNQTTFTYVVTGVDQRPDLSHFDVEIPSCERPLFIVGVSPSDAVSAGVDPTTGVDGIKWDLPLRTTETRTYSISFLGNVSEGEVLVAVKADSFETGTLPGPACEVVSIDVDKFVSADGATWDDADSAPGIEIELGAPVYFRFLITNIGTVELGAIALSDNMIDTSTCTLPATLAPSTMTECVIGPIPSVEGQHTNVATASGTYEETVTTATDSANYFSGDLPLVEIDKLVSKNGGTSWNDSVNVSAGTDVSFKFVITNTGNVALTNLSLTDSVFDTAACALPASIEASATFECVIGPFAAGETEHTNTATISAAFEDQTVSDSDTASYTVSATADDELDVIIVIEGPIEVIDGNRIIIFGVEIELDPNDPNLTRISIGDTIRIEGDMLDNNGVIVVIAVNVIFVDVQVIVNTGSVNAPVVVPPGCKITGIGNNNPRLKCSKRS